jgi:hypothetical protein
MLASGAMHESSGFFQPCPAGDILSKSAAALNSSFFFSHFHFHFYFAALVPGKLCQPLP